MGAYLQDALLLIETDGVLERQVAEVEAEEGLSLIFLIAWTDGHRHPCLIPPAVELDRVYLYLVHSDGVLDVL